MDQKAIGEYLKRLRVRDKYTQSDLGARIGVTDKAISRWESGLGMPEISNLMELAKLYGVSVDDILNLNEAVFAGGFEPELEAASAQENAVKAESADEIKSVPDNGNAQKPADGEQATSNKLIAPSRKFRVILLFAYFVFGTYIATVVPEHNDIFSTVLYVILAVLLVATVVVSCLNKFMSRTAFFVVNVSLWAANAVFMIVLTVIFEFRRLGGEIMAVSVFGRAVFIFLFIMQILYEIVDFVRSDKLKRKFNYVAVGMAVAAVVLALVACALYGDGFIYDYHYISWTMMLSAVGALAFALAQVFSKWVNILTAGCGIPCAIMNFISLFHDGIVMNDTIIEFRYDMFSLNMRVMILIIAITGIFICWFFEGHKPSLAANRIVSIITVLALIPIVVYTVETLAINVILESSALAWAAVVRMVVIMSTVVYCVKLFRPDLLIKSMRKGGKA